jgi:hypothetical protein
MRSGYTRPLLVALLSTVTAACSGNPDRSGASRQAAFIPASVLSSAGRFAARGHSIYVTDYDHYAVREYAIDARGDAAPTAVIYGSNANLFKPNWIALDRAGYLYVQDAPYDLRRYPVVSIFAPTANGDVAPVRAINPESQGDVYPFGIAVDVLGYVYEADTYFRSIEVFAPGANGDARPVRAIGGPHTTISNPFNVAVDAAGSVYVADDSGNASHIAVFAPGASGDVSPTRNIRGRRTLLNSAGGIAFDAGGELYVSNSGSGIITVFAPNANGDVKPARTIAPSPAPFSLRGVAERGGELFVTQEGTGSVQYSIAVYPENANGPTHPLRTIAGPHTGLDGLNAIAVH